jgi:hypothetical protein
MRTWASVVGLAVLVSGALGCEALTEPSDIEIRKEGAQKRRPADRPAPAGQEANGGAPAPTAQPGGVVKGSAPNGGEKPAVQPAIQRNAPPRPAPAEAAQAGCGEP